MPRYPNETHVSVNLTWAELACHDADRTPYLREEWQERAIVLAEEFEYIRAISGNKPIKVLSAYRTEAWNRTIGGANLSQHLFGRALDLSGEDSAHQTAIRSAIEIRSEMLVGMIRGIGVYASGGLHMDTRPTEEIAKWDKFQPAEQLA